MKDDITVRRASSARRHLWPWLLAAILCAGTPLSVAAGPVTAEATAIEPRRHSEPERPLVVATVHPLALIIHQLAGDMLDTVELLAPAQDPHHASLSPSQRRLLGRADLVVWVGPTFESFMARPVASLPEDRVLTWLAGDKNGHHHDSGGHSATAGVHGADPHIWLDIDATRGFSRQLVARLAARYPDLALPLAQRLVDFERRLDASAALLAGRLQPLQSAAFIAEHAAYGPFVDQFALRLVGSLSDSSGVALGARNLWQLKNHRDIACVVVERPPGSKLARQLARGLDVPVVVIDPLGLEVGLEQGYSALLETVAEGFERCLGE